MNKFFGWPQRIDVILAPRDWQFQTYAKGVMFSITGKYDAAGGIARGWVRVGPKLPVEGHGG